MEQIIYENHHLEDIFTIAVCLKIDPQQMSLGFLLDFLLFVYRSLSDFYAMVQKIYVFR